MDSSTFITIPEVLNIKALIDSTTRKNNAGKITFTVDLVYPTFLLAEDANGLATAGNGDGTSQVIKLASKSEKSYILDLTKTDEGGVADHDNLDSGDYVAIYFIASQDGSKLDLHGVNATTIKAPTTMNDPLAAYPISRLISVWQVEKDDKGVLNFVEGSQTDNSININPFKAFSEELKGEFKQCENFAEINTLKNVVPLNAKKVYGLVRMDPTYYASTNQVGVRVALVPTTVRPTVRKNAEPIPDDTTLMSGVQRFEYSIQSGTGPAEADFNVTLYKDQTIYRAIIVDESDEAREENREKYPDEDKGPKIKVETYIMGYTL